MRPEENLGMEFFIALVVLTIPAFCRYRWYVVLAPFFVSIVTGAYFHRASHLLVGLALSVLTAIIGGIITVFS